MTTESRRGFTALHVKNHFCAHCALRVSVLQLQIKKSNSFRKLAAQFNSSG